MAEGPRGRAAGATGCSDVDFLQSSADLVFPLIGLEFPLADDDQLERGSGIELQPQIVPAINPRAARNILDARRKHLDIGFNHLGFYSRDHIARHISQFYQSPKRDGTSLSNPG